MSWEKLVTEDVLSEFTPSEAAAFRILQGSGSGSGSGPEIYPNIDVIVGRCIDEVRGYILAGGYPLDLVNDDTLPMGLFNDAIAIARWRLLISAPQFLQLQTTERKDAFDRALAKLLLVSEQQFDVEPPTPDIGIKTGLWNSENKLIMRTHPIPKPSTQFTPQTDTYANPDAPEDAQAVG